MDEAALLVCVVSLVALALSRGGAAESGPVNLDFEQGNLGEVPVGWFAPSFSQEAGYAAELSEDHPKSGKRCALVHRPRREEKEGFGNLMQAFGATPYRGKRVRFRAAVRAESADPGSRAQLWLRVDRAGGIMGFFDNMDDRPIVTKGWRDYEIIGDVEGDAEQINVGMMLIGEGKAWIDKVSFDVVGKAEKIVVEPARPLTKRGLENLVAFTRLLGYVRHFHPSDEAATTNWDRFAIKGVRATEDAKDAVDLARRLRALFRPIAPTVRVFATGKRPPIPRELLPPQSTRPLKVTMWRHHGFGVRDATSPYHTERVSEASPKGAIAADSHDPRTPFEADLRDGLSCLVPLGLFADPKGTLPHSRSLPQASATPKPSRFPTSGNDRATRLAAVALAWNVLQHFYPYFDVVKVEWDRVLREALSAAATDSEERALLNTLQRMVAELHDGHGNVWHGSYLPSGVLPFLWSWAEGHLVMTHVAPEGAGRLKPGDVVLKVDGRPAAEVIAEKERFISGATPQWRRFRALGDLLAGARDSEVTLEVQRQSGKPRPVTVRRTLQELAEPRPPEIHEIKPGIFYLNLDRITEEEFRKSLPKLKQAKGIVFDLRGYPRIPPDTIGHLIDEPVTCAQWHVPVITYPDRKRMSFQFSNWTVEPKAPRLKAKAAFLTDGRAISYAETYLGIIEHYRLAEIVGEPTAGTNGDTSHLALPGGYTLIWTEMRVLKHDGSQHHGVGIQPTMPVSPTLRGIAEGRDEVLERAVEVVSR